MHHNNQVSQGVWRTPERIRAPVHKVLGSFCDLATDNSNPMGARFGLTEEDDSLNVDWDDLDYESMFLNPPWGKKLAPVAHWAAKAWLWADDNLDGQLIFVSPASTNSQWFHRWLVTGASAHCFPEGRVAYDMPEGFANDSSPTFDTCITYFGPRRDVFRRAFRGVGWCP